MTFNWAIKTLSEILIFFCEKPEYIYLYMQDSLFKKVQKHGCSLNK